VNLRKLIVLVLPCLVVACGKPASSPSPSPAAAPTAQPTPKPLPSPLPENVALVNGHAISGRNLQRIGRTQMAAQNMREVDQAGVYRQLLDQLVVRELLYQAAETRGVKAKNREVERIYDSVRSKSPTEAHWKQRLAEQGYTPEEYRLELRVTQTVQAFLAMETAAITPGSITDTDARAYYDSHPEEFVTEEQLRASHILITVPRDASPEVRDAQRVKAQAILDRARKGADFATLARQNSEDQGSARNGGALPNFGRGRMLKPFEDAAFALAPGGLSEVVETQYGYHIIKLHERLPSRKLPFDEIAVRLKNYLVQQKRLEVAKRLVDDLRSKTKIEILI
jgi:peptidyl-prolyl cis-trans isomerase C